MISKGKLVFSFPGDFQQLARMETHEGVEPINTTIDSRNEEQKEHALQGVIDTCLNDTI